jgi:hypothetical protein
MAKSTLEQLIEEAESNLDDFDYRIRTRRVESKVLLREVDVLIEGRELWVAFKRKMEELKACQDAGILEEVQGESQ